ncbi:hypothetical protein AGMMS50284_3040 [Clostridia bacterium]|nr:hypothetical protein AGMMS50284_3040 [Clostridia bacterium]
MVRTGVLAQKNFTKTVLLNISLFRIFYILTLFWGSFYFVGIPSIILNCVLLVWGLVLFYFYYVHSRRAYNVLYSRWLAAYILAALITATIHFVDNFLLNIVMLLHITICFFIFFGMHTENNKRRIKKEMYFVFSFIVLVVTALSAIGIAMIFITGAIKLPASSVPYEKTLTNFFNLPAMKYNIIIFENRFTGFFTNPNLSSFYSVAAIACAHMLSKKDFIKECGKKPIRKWLLITSSSINLVALFLTDSNAAHIFLGIYVFGNLIYRFFFDAKDSLNFKLLAKRSVALVGCLAIIFSCMFFVRWGFNAGVSSTIQSVDLALQSPDKIASNSNEVPITFGHINKNFDSGRTRLIRESAALIANYPLFGIGKWNLVEYGQRYIKGGLHFSDLHNGYLTILVCSGFVGLAVFIGFAMHLARHCLKSLFLEKRNLKDSVFPCLFAFILGYSIYAMFEKTLLYEQTFMVVFFWLILGYASCYMLKFNHLDQKFDFAALFKKKENKVLDIIDAPTEDS